MSDLELCDGSRIAVVGCGPAGSFFTCLLIDMARRMDLDVAVDVYDPKDFNRPGPAGCNHCGGIVSESLVETLAIEGINLPDTVVQRGIDSYVLHMDVGDVRIETPLHEKRIAAMIRGSGPKSAKPHRWKSFDGHLQSLVTERGATLLREKVEKIGWADGRPEIHVKGEARPYDLLVVATGVNAGAMKLLASLGAGYRPPGTTRTHIREYYLGAEEIERYLGSAMHVFLVDIPRLEFAALIPKGDYVTLCMLGEEIDKELVATFLDRPEVKRCIPPDWCSDANACACVPLMNVRGSVRPFADRMVLIGDCATARLYKDGIGSAWRTARAAATTAVFHGVSAEDFRRHYAPVCRSIKGDNMIGQLVFAVTGLIQKFAFTRRGILRMVVGEQDKEGGRRHMSQVLWDMFTGSASYRDIFVRTLFPAFWGPLLWNIARGGSGTPRAKAARKEV